MYADENETQQESRQARLRHNTRGLEALGDALRVDGGKPG